MNSYATNDQLMKLEANRLRYNLAEVIKSVEVILELLKDVE